MPRDEGDISRVQRLFNVKPKASVDRSRMQQPEFSMYDYQPVTDRNTYKE